MKNNIVKFPQWIMKPAWVAAAIVGVMFACVSVSRATDGPYHELDGLSVEGTMKEIIGTFNTYGIILAGDTFQLDLGRLPKDIIRFTRPNTTNEFYPNIPLSTPLVVEKVDRGSATCVIRLVSTKGNDKLIVQIQVPEIKKGSEGRVWFHQEVSGRIFCMAEAECILKAATSPDSMANAEKSTATEDPRVVTAKKILAEFQAGAPLNHRVLHVAYFCPADRIPAPDYRERLTRVLDDISSFYAEQLRAYGLPSQGIPLDKDADGKVIIHMVKGSRPAAEYSEARSASEIREDVKEVLEADGIGLSTNHVVVFTRLGNHEGTNTWHNSPYCGMGDCFSGFCWQFDSDILDPRFYTNTNEWVNDRQYGHISYGRYQSIFIGGTAHELGHCFGLPHNAETPTDRPVRGHALMGDGNRHLREELRGEGRGSFITLAHALRLVSNPLFSGVDKGLTTQWKVSGTNCVFNTSTAGQLNITGKFTSNLPVYGVVAYVDPDGHDNYDAGSYAGTIGADDTFSFKINSLPKSKNPGEIRIILLCASGQHLDVGDACQFRQRYTIGADGRIDLGKN